MNPFGDRLTFWSCTIGMFLTAFGTAMGQTTVQRFVALKTERDAKMWGTHQNILWSLKISMKLPLFKFKNKERCLFEKISESFCSSICSLAKICSVSLFFSSMLLLAPALTIMFVLTCLTGLVVFAYYHKEGCDPLRAGYITNSNQVCFSTRKSLTHDF